MSNDKAFFLVFAFMNTIIFFARTPEPDHGMTRLRKDVPHDKVDAIVAYLYEHLYTKLSNTPHSLVIHYNGKPPKKDVPVWRQSGDELGETMARSIKKELTRGPVVLIGSDLIGIDEDYVNSAFDALKKNDMVLGPARDGGYGLVGMNHFIDVFSGITYSRSDVLEKTIDRAKKLGKSVHLLDTIRDIDDIRDLAAEVLNSPVTSYSEEKEHFIFIDEMGSKLKVFKKEPKNKSGLSAPTTMMPFFYSISKT